MKNILFILTLPMLFTSCNKLDKLEAQITILNIDNNVPLQKVVFVNDSVGFACGGKRHDFGCIYKTSDAGKNWSKLDLFFPKKNVYELYFLDSLRGFAGTEFNYFYKTIDGGNSWHVVWLNGNQIPYHEVHRPIVRKFQFVNDSCGYFIGGQNYEVGTFYKTIDGGLNWVYDSLKHELRALHFIDNKNGFIAGYGYLGKTLDGGKTVNPIDFPGDFYIGLKMLSFNTIVLAGQNGGVYKTIDNGKTWKIMIKPNGLFGKRHFLTDLNFYNSTSGFITGDHGLILKTEDGGENWKIIDTKINVRINSVSFYNNSAYFSMQNGSILVLDI